ncbi:MAG: hypothetical protein IPJ61_12275 [Tessaracoccus sp.]|uniref:hypothetical protein n=1 Tax=Tessaracoccus sp. TaxID=1971211 RepID=UPI001EB55047|nr:hypothetical protein [Tessaracoccus sp.]MBK7821819.1 hypothetical protein [Tessaracoccus sp.]
MKKLLVIVGVLALIAVLGVGGLLANRLIYQRFTPERCTVTVGEQTTTLTREQATNASIIVAASVERGLPEQAAIVAIATAYQESGLRNLDYGDRDSLGLFQQRPSYGWGTEEEIMDPWYSSNRFYEELVKFDDWETTDVNDIAQKVQRSGHPEAYRKHVPDATAVAQSLLGAPESLSCVNFDVGEPAPEAATDVLDAIGAEYTVDDSAISILTPDDEARIWSAANMAIANSYAAGISSAQVIGREWRADREGWTAAKTTGDQAPAILFLGKR